MQARIKWVEGRAFVAESGSGHAILLDAPAAAGGRGLAPSPMELVLMGTGGCTAVDVVMILTRGRHAVTDCVVSLDAERAESDPKVFTRIVMRFTVTGRGLDRKAVERAVALSAEKYCSASIMIGKTAEIVHEIEVVEG
ncbi:MAG TPA: OsmC family protein [Geminicoccaceae bacterium]|nr:OsmC family protein [Geminicoccus sp.]HMU52954.1 OsmC family protein [Geminicoccaceae bacterium]